MKSSIYYILFVSLLCVTVLNLALRDNAINSSLKLSEVNLNNNNVLYIKINVISFNYIDSLSIKQVGGVQETIFNFSSKTKKASLDFFLNKDEIIEGKFIVRIFNNGEFEEFEQEVVVN